MSNSEKNDNNKVCSNSLAKDSMIISAKKQSSKQEEAENTKKSKFRQDHKIECFNQETIEIEKDQKMKVGSEQKPNVGQEKNLRKVCFAINQENKSCEQTERTARSTGTKFQQCANN